MAPTNKAFLDNDIVSTTLRSLKLRVYCEERDSVTELTRLYSMLSHLKSLEVLELGSYTEDELEPKRANRRLDPALFRLDLRPLKTFTLGWWIIKYTDLLAFLRAQQRLVKAACGNCDVMLNAEHHGLIPSDKMGSAQELLIAQDARSSLQLADCSFEKI